MNKLEDKIEEEEYYQAQLNYLKLFYPDKKIRVKGYGTTDIDVINNKEDVQSILNNYNIKCSICNKSIVGKEWFAILFNPRERNRPIDLLFFCRNNKDNCAVKWGNSKIKEYIKLKLNG